MSPQIHSLPLAAGGRFVSPSIRSHARPMSENTINAALRRRGYTKAEMTGHGFRSMASTLLNEQGWHRDAIERQLAHAERDSIRVRHHASPGGSRAAFPIPDICQAVIECDNLRRATSTFHYLSHSGERNVQADLTNVRRL